MYAENELLYPSSVTPRLRESRGEEWAKLVQRVSSLPEAHPEALAFSLMMIRLDGCLACETDSYRAMRGCTACAEQTLRRYKEPDADLLDQYQVALADIWEHLETTELRPTYVPLIAAAA